MSILYVTCADVAMSVADATTEGKESAVFPLSHRVPRVEDRRVIRGIVAVIRNGFRWNDAPNAQGPHKTLSNRVGRWRRLGVCQRMIRACIPARAKDSHPAISMSCQTKGPGRRV